MNWWKSRDRKIRVFIFEWAWYRAYRVLEAQGEGGVVGVMNHSVAWYRAQKRCKRLRQVISRRQKHLLALTRPVQNVYGDLEP